VVQNRVSIFVGGHRYVLVTDETEEYLREVASYVDKKLDEQKQTFRVSEVDAAVMAALAICDEFYKSKENASHALNQIQGCLEDATRARAEVAELKRELSRLRNSLRS
jgi:cell division protein ZapA